MVKVGDIIVVKDDETVPADCLLISTDPSKQNMGG
jgi:magnesium-transporting ATPase (P-type)